MSNIEWILIIITIFLVILLFRYIQLKKQIRNLADQVNELNSGNSQQMLDISLIDKDLERLAGILNQYNISYSHSWSFTIIAKRKLGIQSSTACKSDF